MRLNWHRSGLLVDFVREAGFATGSSPRAPATISPEESEPPHVHLVNGKRRPTAERSQRVPSAMLGEEWCSVMGFTVFVPFVRGSDSIDFTADERAVPCYERPRVEPAPWAKG